MQKNIQLYYEQHTTIPSPLFGLVKVTPQWIRHLYNKDRNHKRTGKELDIRLKSFILIDKIITQSHLFQEYKTEKEYVIIKKNGTKIKEQREVRYYALVGVIEFMPNKITRLKVVIKQVQWRKHAEFLSVIPAWTMKWYNKFYFDDNL